MTYQPSEDVVFTEMDDDEAVLLHLKTRRYFSLNETGTLIWKALQAGKDTPAIAAALQEVYEIDEAGASEHVQSFLAELSRDELVRRVE